MTPSTEQLQRKAEIQLEQLIRHCHINNPSGQILLEIGFKNGFFLQSAQQAGFTSIGLEVVQSYCDIASRKWPDMDVRWYDGGRMPVDDESCDYVVSFQVLEHAGSLEHILTESFRILKPGGIMYHVCPNYHSFYEGHYKVIWLPFLNRKGAQWYLKMLGKDLRRLESLTLVTPKKIRRILDQKQKQVELLSFGQEEFACSVNLQQIQKVKQPVLQAVLRGISKIAFLRKAFVWIASVLEVFYPITLIVKKSK